MFGSKSLAIVAISGAFLGAGERPVEASLLAFNSVSPADNAATRASWLAAVGIGAPDHLVDFETGFTSGENIHGMLGLFPLGLVISDTSPAALAIIRSGAGSINGSNPVGVFALTQNEQPFLEFDFSANPVDYFGFQDIDHTGTTGIVTFVGGATAMISFESTGGTGNSAEFFGIFRNDMPGIVRVQLDSSGDGLWGVDNLEYGVAVAAVPEPGGPVLLGLGLTAIGLVRRRRKSS